MILYVFLAWIGVPVMVMIAVVVAMAEVVGTKVAAAEDVAVGGLGCDVAGVIVGGYLGELVSTLMR